MNHRQLIALAATVCATGTAMAQKAETYAERMNKPQTAKTFDLASNINMHIRNIVYLKDGKMILELMSADDYASFRPMDSLLKNLKRDIAFYKDSLKTDGGTVRIDYVISPEYTYSKIRFKKYPQDGDIFLNKNGVSRLKMDQDTVNIIIEKLVPGLSKIPTGCNINYSARATFLLNSYTDIEKLISHKDEIAAAMDTVEQKSKMGKKPVHPAYTKPVTVIYNPYYNGSKRLTIQHTVVYTENSSGYSYPEKRDNLTLNINMGVSMITNTLSPMAEAGIEFDRKWGRKMENISFFRLSASPYFFFNRNYQNDLQVRSSWFVNATFGSCYKKVYGDWPSRLVDFGVGYMFKQNSDFFKGPTFKLFTELSNGKLFTLCPEIIVTDNFSHIYPALTLKVF